MEVKSTPEGDNEYHPPPKEFAQLIIKELDDFQQINQLYLMSFDARILEELHRLRSHWKTIILFENTIPELSFSPVGIGPHQSLVQPDQIDRWRLEGLKIFVWTVNSFRNLNKISKMQIDGIITDYPERLL